VEQTDVPIQYGIQTTEMTLAPPSRGVAVADFPLTIPHFYRGRLVVDEHGKRVVPKYGQVRVAGGKPESEVISPLGEAGDFELDGVEPGRRKLTIDYANGSCELQLDIADTDETIVDLGELVCRLP
jgi:outer membrane usher protein FimD/PapC